MWVGVVAGAADAQTTPPGPAGPTDEVLKKLASFQLGGNCDTVASTEDLVRKALGDPQAKAELARKLTRLLESTDATLDARKFACRQLRMIADAPEVPALAVLLADKDMADMARYAMERIPDPSAGAALLAALPKASPSQKVGLINSLGERAETAAIGELAKLIRDDDQAVARAAISALGRIGSVEAATALERGKAAAPETARHLFTSAQLACADRLVENKKLADARHIYGQLGAAPEKPHVRIHAARGLLMLVEEKERLPKILDLLAGSDRVLQVMAADEARQVNGTAVCKALAEALPKLSTYAQVLALGVLADRGDSVATPAVLEAAKHQDDAIAIAALVALGQVADASAVPFLCRQATEADLARIEDLQPKGPVGGAMVSIVPFVDFSRGNAARSSLIALKARDADAAILKVFDTADTKTKAVLANCLAARLAVGSVPVLLSAAEDKDGSLRNSAIKALGVLATEKELPALVGFYVRAATDPDRATAEGALLAAVRRVADRNRRADPVLAAYATAPPTTRASLLRVLAQIVCPKSLDAIRSALKESGEVYETAARALSDWPERTVVPDLLDLAQTAKTPTLRLLALRGYIRLAGEAETSDQKMAMYQRAARLIQRNDERKLLLSGLGNVGTEGALKMVEPYLSDETLKDEAVAAAISIAEKLTGPALAEAKALMRKIPEITRNAWLRHRARVILDKP